MYEVDMQTIKITDILLPADADMHTWAVNACDQFTSDYSYWEEVERLTHGKPSTFHMIFPEIYLKDNPEKRIAAANSAMENYLKTGVFKSVKDGFILVERATESGVRTGGRKNARSFHRGDHSRKDSAPRRNPQKRAR